MVVFDLGSYACAVGASSVGPETCLGFRAQMTGVIRGSQNFDVLMAGTRPLILIVLYVAVVFDPRIGNLNVAIYKGRSCCLATCSLMSAISRFGSALRSA